jgi:hypothetical protein
MTASFSFDVDVARDLLRVRMAGFFTAQDMLEFQRARIAAHAKLACGPNQHVTLADLREFKIQTQEIVETFRKLLSDPRLAGRRFAFVMGPTLARSQLVRAAGNRDVRFFLDTITGEHWLFHGEDIDAA